MLSRDQKRLSGKGARIKNVVVEIPELLSRLRGCEVVDHCDWATGQIKLKLGCNRTAKRSTANRLIPKPGGLLINCSTFDNRRSYARDLRLMTADSKYGSFASSKLETRSPLVEPL